MENFWGSVLFCLAAMIVVTLIGILHTIFNIKFLHMKSMAESPGMGDAYEKTKPFHSLYNIVIFPIFAGLYFRTLGTVDFKTAALTSLVWGTLIIVFDFFGWVVIKHPWSMSVRDFYIKYQPWITLIYLAIYASPFLAYFIMG